MQPGEIAFFIVSACLIGALIIAFAAVFVGVARSTRERKGKLSPREWWAAHKPTKRRLIQVYAALLANANIKGFIVGDIYKGNTKYACLPGLNCYSCPGATGACPLGSLQNALAASGTRAPWYVLGILILFGVILGRTICGFLCPFGLFQDLLYKIKTPKVKKSRVTRIFSYLKYVLLAVFVVCMPLMFGFGAEKFKVPTFCKYICPAGTLGGAVGLLVHPENAGFYGMLGGLFSWKMLVLVAVITASVFFYRFFCRFLCPLGAFYGLFNRIALLGIKLDRNKCTDCGLCISHCKMDIAHVGDHECINCGECIDVCPAKAISWKGSRLFVHANAVEQGALAEERPLSAMPALNGSAGTMSESSGPVLQEENVSRGNARPSAVADAGEAATPATPRKRRGKAFWLEAAAWTLALIVLAGALVYYNFLADPAPSDRSSELAATHYFFSVSSRSGAADTLSFTVSDGGESANAPTMSGDGTEKNPYVVEEIVGNYSVEVGEGEAVFFAYQAAGSAVYTVTPQSENLCLSIYYYNADFEQVPLLTVQDGSVEPRQVTLTEVASFGTDKGDYCFDFTLDAYFGRGEYSLSAHRGKIVIVNFWYTTCDPCKEEMPDIARIAEKYAEDVSVVAIHSAMITENGGTDGVQRWLEEMIDPYGAHWSDYAITYAQDRGEGLLTSRTFTMLGGKSAYPVTVIVDREGRVAYTRQGKVTSAILEAQLRPLL